MGKAADANDGLEAVPTCEFGYDLGSDFEDEEINEEMAFNSEDSDFENDPFMKNKDLDYKKIEAEVRLEAKRIGSKLLDLSDMLESDEEQVPSTNVQEKGEKSDSDRDDDGNDDGSDIESEEEEDDDDDESESDEDDQGSEEDEIDEDPEEDDEAAHAALMSVVEKLSRRDSTQQRRNADRLLKEMKPTSTDNDDYLPVPKTSELSLDALINPLRMAPSFTSVKASLDKLASDPKSKIADVPLEPVHRHRLERTTGYKEISKQMDKWTHLVKANREAEQISFPLKQHSMNESSASLVAKFKPSNSLELDLQALMNMYKAEQKQAMTGEQLEMNELSPEQVEERQAEIAKMRSLLFYHELRAKRVKKIKSKKYRKMLKKAAAKTSTDQGDEESRNEITDKQREKREIERINARMSLRVKNTSKWLKTALKNGGLVDPEVKSMVAEQQRNVDALRSRMESVKDDVDSSDDGSDDEHDEIELIKQEIEQDKPANRKGLFGLKFMVTAAEKQKAGAQEMMREFERAADSDGDDDGDENSNELRESADPAPVVAGRRSFTPGKGNSMTQTEFTKEDVNVLDKLPQSLQLSSVGFTSAGYRATTADAISILPISQQGEDQRPQPVLCPTEIDTVIGFESGTKGNRKTKRSSARKNAPVEKPKENPWANANASTAAHRDRKSTAHDVVIDTALIDSNDHDQGDIHEFTIVPASANQDHRALVEKAFATAGDELQDFMTEKMAVIDQDVPDEKDSVLPGWGSWAGAGVKINRASRKRAAQRTEQAAIKKKILIDKRQDASLSHVIINEKHDKKIQKYRLASVPYPFTSQQQYERHLETPIGREWNTASGHSDLIRPAVTCKMGAIIDPITYSKPVRTEKQLADIKKNRIKKQKAKKSVKS